MIFFFPGLFLPSFTCPQLWDISAIKGYINQIDLVYPSTLSTQGMCFQVFGFFFFLMYFLVSDGFWHWYSFCPVSLIAHFLCVNMLLPWQLGFFCFFVVVFLVVPLYNILQYPLSGASKPNTGMQFFSWSTSTVVWCSVVFSQWIWVANCNFFPPWCTPVLLGCIARYAGLPDEPALKLMKLYCPLSMYTF